MRSEQVLWSVIQSSQSDFARRRNEQQERRDSEQLSNILRERQTSSGLERGSLRLDLNLASWSQLAVTTSGCRIRWQGGVEETQSPFGNTNGF